MATSYLGIIAGRVKEIIAAIAGGPANAGLLPVLDVNGRLTLDMMPAGLGPDAITLTAAETLVAGAWVNITSTGTVRNASAAGIGTRAHGYVNSNVASGQPALVMFDDSNTGVTGSPIGDLWLSATPGQATVTPPTGAGVISQRLGVGITATTIHASIQEPVILAQ